VLDGGIVIYTVTLNPTIDRTLIVDRFHIGGTFKTSHSELLPAGKGVNVARVVAMLGEPVAALGLVGEHDAALFDVALVEAGISNRLVPVPGLTRSSVTILDPVEGTETHLREQGSVPPAEALARVETSLEGVCPGDWVVLSGSLPPGVPVDTYRTLIRLCARRGAYTLFDASGPPLLSGIGGAPTLLKPNLFELWQADGGQAEAMTERTPTELDTGHVADVARRIQARGIAQVVVSRGEQGVVGLGRDGRVWRARTVLDRPVIDAVGSGDALAAGLVVALAREEPFPSALALGVACGAANTLVAGAGRCQVSDIDRLWAKAIVSELR
jgi:tagatose 6-phosphate kinase